MHGLLQEGLCWHQRRGIHLLIVHVYIRMSLYKPLQWLMISLTAPYPLPSTSTPLCCHAEHRRHFQQHPRWRLQSLILVRISARPCHDQDMSLLALCHMCHQQEPTMDDPMLHFPLVPLAHLDLDILLTSNYQYPSTSTTASMRHGRTRSHKITLTRRHNHL